MPGFGKSGTSRISFFSVSKRAFAPNESLREEGTQLLHFRLDLFKSAHFREARTLMQMRGQLVQLLRGADSIGLHAAIVEVPDPAGHADVPGGAFHERAESDTLHAAGHQPAAS